MSHIIVTEVKCVHNQNRTDNPDVNMEVKPYFPPNNMAHFGMHLFPLSQPAQRVCQFCLSLFEVCTKAEP